VVALSSPPLAPLAHDRHALYEAAVQGVDYDLDFLDRLFRHLRGRPARVLREDFCGTAALACAWALRHPSNLAWGVDLDPEPLAWALRWRLAQMKHGADRVHLTRGDVLHARVPRADVTLAYNFSFWVFKTREELLAYFRAARRGLATDGVFLLAMFGGTDAIQALRESRRIPTKQGPNGRPLPAFRYVWRQDKFNPITHDLECSIDFEIPGRRPMRRAFAYDWRMWTLPEVRELLAEAGFRESRVYVEGWDDDARKADGVYHRRRSFENQEGWLSLVAGIR